MPYNIPALILPLIGGYIIINKSLFFRHKYRRISSQRLVFDSFIAGIILFAATYFIRESIYFVLPSSEKLCHNIVSYFPYHAKLLGTSVTSFLFAVAFVYSSNLVINKWFEDYKYGFFTRLIFEIGDELEQLFLETLLEQDMVQISLKNNKVYIGFIAEVNEPQKTNYISLIPIFSGYRKPRSKRLVITTPYHDVVDALIDNENEHIEEAQEDSLDSDYMKIVIKQDEILTASRFDPEVYNLFQDTYEEAK